MKPAVFSESSTILSSDSPNVYVSESAQHRLDALRSSVEVRLAALEAALADPSRGDSLETLILDLARVACEESQATAIQACADTRLEAEMHIGQARTVAQAAVDQEVASSTEVRGLLEEAQQRILSLQHEVEEGRNRARETFEADLTKERATNTELERTVAKLERSIDDARNDLNNERSQTKALRQENDRLDVELSALKRDHSEYSSQRNQLEAEIARAREATVESQRAHAETQAQLALERNTLSELRRASEKTAEQLAALGRREADARNSHEHITRVYDETVAELRREREAYAELRQSHKNLQEQASAGQSVTAEFERVQAEVQQRLAAEQHTVSDLRRQLAALQERYDADHSAVAKQRHAESNLQGELEAERTNLVDAKRLLADLQERFDAERATTAELRRAAAQTEARMQTAIDTEHALRAQLAEAAANGKQTSQLSDAAAVKMMAALKADVESQRGQLAAFSAKLETEQRLTTNLRQRESELEARLATEKATNAELRTEMRHVQERGHAGNQDVQSVRDALALARNEVQSLRDELESARARMEKALGERADTERLLQESESRLKRAIRDRDELTARLEGSPHEVHEPVKSTSGTTAGGAKPVSGSTPPNVVPHSGAKAAGRHGKPVAKLKDDEAWVAVRLSPRYGFSEPVAVQVNGTASQLCDLSVGGCQVLSQTALKPNQTVKVTLPGAPKAISCSGKIVWAKLEAPALGRPAGYRAGVQFAKPDHAAIEAFIANHRVASPV